MKTNSPISKENAKPLLGIIEWFRVNDYDHVQNVIEKLKILGIKELRTDIIWAEYNTPEGEKWYNWLIPLLGADFNILPCFHGTPPDLSISGKMSAPPKDPALFASFIENFIALHGGFFDYVELWNEPNNRSEYDYFLDENWNLFSSMIIEAAQRVHSLGKKTVLGGISPIDPSWVRKMGDKKVLEHIDIIGIHGFPDVFNSQWGSWDESISSIQNVLNTYNNKIEIWITETGYSTWRFDERKQIEKFIDVLQTPVKRVYWYSLYDIPTHMSTIGGHHVDEREYHFGMIGDNGMPKLLYRLWAIGGIKNVIKNKWMTYSQLNGNKNHKQPVLVTGGAGFIGTNVAYRLLKLGYPVYIYDNLSRPGVENNLKWLKERYKENLYVTIADVRDEAALKNAVNHVSHVFHFAGQVAVTTSLENPVLDYSVNVGGTLNLLEIIRKSPHKPSLIFTSTNKVYGNLNDIQLESSHTRYYPQNEFVRNHGVNELRRLDFQSPYGSSKGAADQYILDYARSYDLNNVVFRMSCIYGKHQFGTEDQGWVAHFMLKALKEEPITIYGDGLQVRDILFVDDLVDAFLLAWDKIESFKGEVFNIGGGSENAISLIELIQIIEAIRGHKVSLSFDEWRRGDQKYYVSDTSKFRDASGWAPSIGVAEGVKMLHEWLKKYYRTQLQLASMEEEFENK
ncbi:MAG TPA: SDR family NAD(P)-dependent oxidoreductase [Bacteroidales bacterium]|nr:SDR family NAD(P)-dependent oxidoreductase [Bacteroidales bacterium]